MLRSGKICASFLYKYLTSDIESNDNEDDGGFSALDKRSKQLKCLCETFQSYGGVLSKISQVMSLNDEKSSVFSECSPFSTAKTTKFFQNYCYERKLEKVDFNVYKSGSVGQVHKAMIKDQPVIFKVQYVGLQKQSQKDLAILDKVTSYLYHFTDMKEALSDIKTKMNDEFDYTLELLNQIKMKDLYHQDPFIEIPDLMVEWCTDKILCMNLVDGISLKKFIKEADQNSKNQIGFTLVRYIFQNIYQHNIFYSDVHYGNFLIKKDNTLCILDFGCLHTLEPDFVKKLKTLHLSIQHENQDDFYQIVTDLGIINDEISPASRKYIYDYFKLQFTPWTSEEFEFTPDWLEKSCFKNTELMKEWKLPKNMVYFNKIPYGSYHIFTKLKLKGNFKKIFKQLIIGL